MDELGPEDLARALADIPLFREIQRVLAARSGPVNWEIAQQIARAVGGAGKLAKQPTDSEQSAFEEAVRIAQMQLSAHLGVDLPTHLTRVTVHDRIGWAEGGLSGLSPLIDRLSGRLSGQLGLPGIPAQLPVQSFFDALGPFLIGVQVGFLSGHLARRQLGGYDLPLPRDPDELTFIFPNIWAVAEELDLDHQQFILWVALHEVAHQSQFLNHPWLGPHLVSLVSRYIDAAEIDPTQIISKLQNLGDPDELMRITERPDQLLPLLVNDEQRAVLPAIQTLLAVIEGHADHAMNAIASAGLLPQIDKIKEGINRRRAETSSADRLLEQLLGIDLKPETYRAGVKFVDAISDAGRLDGLLESPHSLPLHDELGDPGKWLSRIGFS